MSTSRRIQMKQAHNTCIEFARYAGRTANPPRGFAAAHACRWLLMRRRNCGQGDPSAVACRLPAPRSSAVRTHPTTSQAHCGDPRSSDARFAPWPTRAAGRFPCPPSRIPSHRVLPPTVSAAVGAPVVPVSTPKHRISREQQVHIPSTAAGPGRRGGARGRGQAERTVPRAERSRRGAPGRAAGRGPDTTNCRTLMLPLRGRDVTLLNRVSSSLARVANCAVLAAVLGLRRRPARRQPTCG